MLVEEKPPSDARVVNTNEVLLVIVTATVERSSEEDNPIFESELVENMGPMLDKGGMVLEANTVSGE